MSIWSTGSSTVTLGWAASAARSVASVPQVGTAAKRTSGKASASVRNIADSLYSAGVHHGNEFVVEAAKIGPRLTRHERDGHVDCVDAGVTGERNRRRIGSRPTTTSAWRMRAVWASLGKAQSGPKGSGQRGAHQINNAGAGGEGGFEKELRGVVGGAENHVGAKGCGFCDERGPQLGVGGCADVDAFDVRGRSRRGRRRGIDGHARPELPLAADWIFRRRRGRDGRRRFGRAGFCGGGANLQGRLLKGGGIESSERSVARPGATR